MSHGFCEQKDERGLRIRTKAEQFMADTALKNKSLWIMDTGLCFPWRKIFLKMGMMKNAEILVVVPQLGMSLRSLCCT